MGFYHGDTDPVPSCPSESCCPGGGSGDGGGSGGVPGNGGPPALSPSAPATSAVGGIPRPEPKKPIAGPVVGKGSTNTTYVRMTENHSRGSDLTTSGCVSLPLKSGESYPLNWTRWGGMPADRVEYFDNWAPAGEGAVFSFLPVVNTYFGSRQRTSENGGLVYSALDIPSAEVSYIATRGPTYWTEYNPEKHVYFEYFAGSSVPTSNKAFGRLNRYYDTRGNELLYHYGNNVAGNPLLRRITGFAGSIVAYFQYADETISGSTRGVITKMRVGDVTLPETFRTVYFNYTLSATLPFMSGIVNPEGCASQYDPESSTGYTLYNLKKEVDAEGYATYYDYTTSGVSSIDHIVEPEGRISYFFYGVNVTPSASLGRPRRYTTYELDSGGYAGRITRDMDSQGKTAYFAYDASVGRSLRRVERNGNLTYFGYVGGSSSTGYNRHALTASISQFNNARAYYEYDGLTYNLKKIVHARHVPANFPVVTYYAYDGFQEVSELVTALGERTQCARDSFGRLIRFHDARGFTTYFHNDAATSFMSSRMDALGGVSYFGYDSFGNVTRSLSPRWAEAGSYSAFTSYFAYDSLDRTVKAIDPLGKTTYFEWTSRGDLLERIDPKGTVTGYSYNGLRLRTEELVSEASGRVVSRRRLGYDIYKNLSRSQDDSGNTTYFGYDSLDRLSAQVDPYGRSTYFYYNSMGKLIARTDPRANSVYHFYDNLIRESASRDACGHLTYYGYDLGDNRTQVLDARLNATYYFYDQLSRTSAIRDAQGGVSYFFYDSMGNWSFVMDALGRSAYFFYDGLSRRIGTQDAIGGLSYFVYDRAGNRTQAIDALGRATSSFYDRLDRRNVAVDALGKPTYFFYDSVGNPVVVRDARGNATYFAFDGVGRRTAVQDALGNVTYFNWNADGNLTSHIDARGSLAYFSYDRLNRLALQHRPDASEVDYEYDESGNLSAVWETTSTTAQGYGAQAYGTSYYGGWEPVNTRFWDSENHLSVDRGILGNATYYFYDTVGNSSAVRDPLGRPAYFGYDTLDRMSRVQDALGAFSYFEYDVVGNLTRALDPDGHELKIRYDALNRRDALHLADGGTAYFVFDAVSNLTKEIAPRGNATYYGYDDADRLTKLQDTVGRSVYFEYDAIGNQSRYVDAEGAASVHTYDALNRRTRTDYSTAGSVIAAGLRLDPYYAYDEVGNLTQMGDLWGLHRMGYDVRNRAVRHVLPAGQVVYFEYNARSQPTALVYPSSGGTARMDYDSLFRPSKVQAPSGNTAYFVYDAASQMTGQALGNGTKLDITYDAAGRFQNWRYSSAAGASLTYFDYTRDAKGLIIKIVREAIHTIYYAYDDNDRLTAEIWAQTGPSPSEVYGYRYAYDVAGNRTKARRNGVDVYYAYDLVNQLTVRGTDAAYAMPTYYVYDLNGSLTDQIEPGGTTKFAYNPTGMVARVKWQDSTSTYFFYDGQLQRFGLLESGTAAYFLWDGLNVLEELNPDLTTKERLTNRLSPIAGIGQVVESFRPAESAPLQRLHPLLDSRGSIVKWHGSDGSTVLAAREYDAFGQTIPNSKAGTWPNRLTYQGNTWQELFSGGGAKSFLFSPYRIYDPVDGRFLQNEPRLYERAQSQYLYCNQNPPSAVDVLGLEGQSIVVGTISPEYNLGDRQVDEANRNDPSRIPSTSAKDFYEGLNKKVTDCRKCGKPWTECCISKLVIDGHGSAGVGGGQRPSDYKPEVLGNNVQSIISSIKVVKARMDILRGLFCPGALILHVGCWGYGCGDNPKAPDWWRVEVASLLTKHGGEYGGFRGDTWGAWPKTVPTVADYLTHVPIPKDADEKKIHSRLTTYKRHCPGEGEECIRR